MKKMKTSNPGEYTDTPKYGIVFPDIIYPSEEDYCDCDDRCKKCGKKKGWGKPRYVYGKELQTKGDYIAGKQEGFKNGLM